MKIGTVTNVLMVEDVKKTVDYYHQNLGLDFVVGVPSGTEDHVIAIDDPRPLQFAIMKGEESEWMFQSRESIGEELPEMAGQPCGGTFDMYISVEDTDAWYAELKDRVNVVKPPFDTFYGAREFCFKDLNGYFITLTRRPQSI